MNDKTLLLELAAIAPEWTPDMLTPATTTVIDIAA